MKIEISKGNLMSMRFLTLHRKLEFGPPYAFPMGIDISVLLIQNSDSAKLACARPQNQGPSHPKQTYT